MIRRGKLIIFLTIIIIFTFILCGFTVDSKYMNNNSKQYNTEDYDIRVSIAFEPYQKPKFNAFDVNAEGMVAISINDDTFSGVLVYDKHGKFEFGLNIDCEGSFLAEWSGNNINIICIRSKKVATFDMYGNCIAVTKYPQNIIKTREYLTGIDKTADGDTYTAEIQKSIWGAIQENHKQLTRIQPDGTQTIIYNSNKPFWSKDLIVNILICTLATIILVLFFIQTRRRYIASNQSKT